MNNFHNDPIMLCLYIIVMAPPPVNAERPPAFYGQMAIILQLSAQKKFYCRQYVLKALRAPIFGRNFLKYMETSISWK